MPIGNHRLAQAMSSRRSSGAAKRIAIILALVGTAIIALIQCGTSQAQAGNSIFDDDQSQQTSDSTDNAARQNPTTEPTTPPVANTPAAGLLPDTAVQAERRYESAIAAGRALAQKQIDEARAACIRDLRAILKTETQAEHLDAALAVRDEINRIDSGSVNDSVAGFKPRVVNLMPYIDASRDTINGVWSMTADGLASDSTPSARIRIPYEPPDEYDFRITFTVQGGDDGVGQLLCHRGICFEWCMGGWDRHEWWGLDSINGRDPPDNPTGTHGGSLVVGRRMTSVVKVRRDGVVAEVNGKVEATWPTDYRDFGRSRDRNIGSNAMLGLRTFNRPTIFHSIELVELSGPGAPSALKYIEPLGKHVDVLALADLKRDVVSGDWQRSGRGLLSGPQPDATIKTPYHAPREYDYVVSLVKLSGNDCVRCAFPFGRHSAVVELGGFGNHLTFVKQDNRGLPADWATSGNERDRWLTSGVSYTAEVQVRSDRIRGYLNGDLVTECKTNGSDLDPLNWGIGTDGVVGLGSYETPTLFKSAEVIEVSAPNTISGKVQAVSERWERLGPMSKGIYLLTATGQWSYAPGHMSGPDGTTDRSAMPGSEIDNLGLLVGRIVGTTDLLRVGSRKTIQVTRDGTFIEMRMWDDPGRFGDNQGEVSVAIAKQ